MDTRFMNNDTTVTGEVAATAEFSHKMMNERFFKTFLKIERMSGTPDVVPIMFSEYLINPDKVVPGIVLKIKGQFRSYNKHTTHGEYHLMLYVHSIDIEIVPCNENQVNKIMLDGYICKKPTYRETPFGRQLCDMLVAVNRPCGKSDYIPCIAWGRNAKRASDFEIGTHVALTGRIQSREYQKRITEEKWETRTAYEVSANGIEVTERKEEE